jgi:hypothetical protein
MNDTAEVIENVELVDVSAPSGEATTLDDNPLMTEFADRYGVDSEDDIITWLKDSQEISFPAAVRMYADLKKSVAEDSADSKHAQVLGSVRSWYEAGFDRKQIIQLLQDTYEYTPKSAASMYSTVGKTLGILGEGRVASAKVPLPVLVEACRSASDKSRAGYTKIISELGYSEATAAHFANYIPMAKEWAKQEMS